MALRTMALVGITIAGVLLAVATLVPENAYACSPDADYDPVATSDVIAEGRILGFQVLPDGPIPGGYEPKGVELDFQDDPFIPIRIEFAVDVVYKGQVAEDVISIVEPRAYGPHPLNEGEFWWLIASDCHAFRSDPTGQYAILGLGRNDDGTYGAHLLQTFYLGAEPSSEDREAVLARLASFPGAVGLPGLGSGPQAGGGVSLWLIAAGAVALGATLIASSVAVRAKSTAVH